MIRISLFLIMIAGVLVSCQKKSETVAIVSFSFPASQTSSKVSSQAVNFARVCYLANIKGGSIAPKKKSSCDVPLGIHTEFQKPESPASVSLPYASNYTLEIFAVDLNSVSEPCPKFSAGSFSGLNLAKIYLVGSTGFSVESSEVAVTVEVTDPGSNIATLYNMPATCTAGQNENGGPILVSPGGLRLYRAVDATDASLHSSTINGFRLLLDKDGSR